jgi:hypothetical protein
MAVDEFGPLALKAVRQKFVEAGWVRNSCNSGVIRAMDVALPTRSGPEIRTRCISKPTDQQQILLEKLRLKLSSKIVQRKM